MYYGVNTALRREYIATWANFVLNTDELRNQGLTVGSDSGDSGDGSKTD